MESKQYAFVNNIEENLIITTGDIVKAKTKDESIIGRVLNLTSNYLTLEIPKSNINIYKFNYDNEVRTIIIGSYYI